MAHHFDTYATLYDKAERTPVFQVYSGSLECILEEIISVLKKDTKSKEDYSILAFQAPRIIRGLIDNKQENPSAQSLTLLQQGISVALQIYQSYDSLETVQSVEQLRDQISRFDGKLLGRKVKQYEDTINLVASAPQFSRASANRLYELVGTEDTVLFVAAHGGINTGLDVALHYEALAGKKLYFYPIRYSRTEYKGYMDKEPCLTEKEKETLRKLVQGKKIIVFDENSNTGKGIGTVAKAVKEHIAQGQPLSLLYNIDSSKPGEWAELFGKLVGELK